MRAVAVFMIAAILSMSLPSTTLYANTLSPNEITASESVEGNDEISLRSIEGGGNGGIVTSDTVRYTVSNSNKQHVTDLLAAHIMTKLPVKFAKSTIVNFIATKAFGSVNYDNAYIESWNWKVREGSNCYRHYATVNHYSDSSYSNLVNTNQIPLSLECN